MLEKLVPETLKKMIKRRSGAPDIFFSLEKLKKLGFSPSTIIDVGAYTGQWTKQCCKIFPDAQYLMIEAMQQKKICLDKLSAANKNINVAIELLGARTGDEVYFSEVETASSVLEEATVSHIRERRTTKSLNDLIFSFDIEKVDLLKLDVQGYELEVLKGFDNFLYQTDVILSEVCLLDIHKGAPTIRDVLNFMYEFGFVVYDICSVDTRRPLDHALWQTDLLFVKEKSVFRNDKRYQK